jgi:hypothetical protein
MILTKRELEDIMASNNAKIEQKKNEIEQKKNEIEELHSHNAQLQSDLDAITNIRVGDRYYESVLQATYIVSRVGNYGYVLINTKTGCCYTQPMDNINDIFAESEYKFSKLPRRA